MFKLCPRDNIYLRDIALDLPFLHIHNAFTKKSISIYVGKHSRMSLDTKDCFVKQISHLSKGVVLV